MAEPLRIVIAEDNYLVREGVRRLLESSGRVEVVAAVDNASDLVAVTERAQPDAVLTDIRMPPTHHMEGIEAAHTIRRQHPSVGVVVLSQYAAAAYALELFRHGAAGLAYLLKERIGDYEQLLHALEEVAAGRSVIDPDVVDRLLTGSGTSRAAGLQALTPRELDVLRTMAAGHTNTGIAEALHLSESSVEKHINSIFTKLELPADTTTHRRVAAVVTYLRDSSHDLTNPRPGDPAAD